MSERGEYAPTTVLSCLGDLTDRRTLSRAVGEPVAVIETAIEHIGCSASMLSKVRVGLADGTERALVRKVTFLRQDWLASRTRDTGREAKLAVSRDCRRLWQIVACPYLAVAREGDAVGLLMSNWADCLFPDSDRLVTADQADGLLCTLARMHAAYWNDASLAYSDHLLRAWELLDILGPTCLRDDHPQPIAASIRSGWALVRDNLPPALWRWLSLPGEVLWQPLAHLPQTLVHGDFRLANLAWFPDGKVGAFDWAFSGWAPGAFDVGWLIVTDGQRMGAPKTALLRRYRGLLEHELGQRFDAATWQAMIDAAVLCALRMYLWGKALDLREGLPRAKLEWQWWVRQRHRLKQHFRV